MAPPFLPTAHPRTGDGNPVLDGNYLWFFTGTPPADSYAGHFARDPYYVSIPEVCAGADPASPWPTYPTAVTADEAAAAYRRAIGALAVVGIATFGAVLLASERM